MVMWPAGQSRQEVEAGAGWYLEAGQEVQTPSMYLPAGQPAQSARRVEPVPVVEWPAGQSRQEVEAEAGWYLEAGQEAHPAGAHSLKPAPCCDESEWKVNGVVPAGTSSDTGKAVDSDVGPQYLVPPFTCT